MSVLTSRRRPKPNASRVVRRDGAVPLYRRLFAALRDDIRRGAVGSADPLPSESRLRARFGSVAEELGIAATERCVLVKRRHLMHRQPVALTVMHLPKSVAGAWSAEDFRATTVIELAAEHGLGAVEGGRDISACIALDDIASTLSMSVGDPVLMRSRSHLASGGALESGAFSFNPRRYSFLFSFSRSAGAAQPADAPATTSDGRTGW